MSDKPAYMIRPGCEIRDVMCGQSCHCVIAQFCEAHQDWSEGEWPCEPQREFEASPEFKADVLGQEVKALRESVDRISGAYAKLHKDHERVVRIIEQAVMPFMRDVMGEYGSHLTINASVGDAPSLLGMDKGFMRGGARPNGIVYKGADGRTWVDGVLEPVKLGERGSMTDMVQGETKSKPKPVVYRFDTYRELRADFERALEVNKDNPRVRRVRSSSARAEMDFADGSKIVWKLRKDKRG